MRLVGQTFSMGVATMMLALHIGRAQITPGDYPPFLMGARAAFTTFVALSLIGTFISLARGKVRKNA